MTIDDEASVDHGDAQGDGCRQHLANVPLRRVGKCVGKFRLYGGNACTVGIFC
jgi:hypothetical protein